MKRDLLIILCFMIWCASAFALNKEASVDRGERLFKTYCSACHTLRYHHHPQVALPAVEAGRWFGKMPPDLSLTARERGRDWLFAYLEGFYPDPHQPFGSNNHAFPDVQMPNVLAPKKAAMNSPAFHQTVVDIVNYLEYVADPSEKIRHLIGYGVITFLVLLLLLCWLYARDHSKCKF